MRDKDWVSVLLGLLIILALMRGSAMSLTDGLFVWLVFVFGFLAGWSARVYLTEAQKGMRRLPTLRATERR